MILESPHAVDPRRHRPERPSLLLRPDHSPELHDTIHDERPPVGKRGSSGLVLTRTLRTTNERCVVEPRVSGRSRLRGPGHRVLEIVVSEVPKLRIHEVLGEPGRERSQGAVRTQRDAPNLPVMLTNKTQVPQDTAQILPTRKLARVNHQPT